MDTSSNLYRLDQRCAYHSNIVEHDIEDYINLKHKIQDLIVKKMVSLQTAPQCQHQSFADHGGININMIETDDEWCMTKVITPIIHDELEKVISFLSVKEKNDFVILTPAKVVGIVPLETPSRPKFVIESAAAQGMTQSGRCYTPKELALRGQKKD